ncbi:MAG: hypothetical protein H9W81_10120 [Enterococcus sp.]|nr:hypothetical protein [Enterococcus sp.]
MASLGYSLSADAIPVSGGEQVIDFEKEFPFWIETRYLVEQQIILDSIMVQ